MRPVLQRPLAVVFGTRPEAIKLAPVVAALRARRLSVLVVSTGQHAELVEQILEPFDIEPDVDLRLMRPGQTLDYVLAGAISAVGDLLEDRQPSALVVQGDTSSMLGATLAAFHHGVPVAHVEAGLRSHDMGHPFPEEMNRRAASTMVRWHFAPTSGAVANLASEGISDAVFQVGNTVVDAVRHLADRPEARVPQELSAFVAEGPYLLATAHRRESWDGGIERIAAGLREVLHELPDHRLVFVTHPNPAARGPVDAVLGGEARARVMDAVGYPQFVALLQGARLVVSDSGGVQEEGPTLGVPVLVTRRTTERPEGVEAGAVRLIGTEVARVRDETLGLLRDGQQLAAMRARGRGIYGDGHAAERIADILVAALEALEGAVDSARPVAE
jgi:UDP-N-acetylglucosamine 2-epimerase (non-hydrolysing)